MNTKPSIQNLKRGINTIANLPPKSKTKSKVNDEDSINKIEKSNNYLKIQIENLQKKEKILKEKVYYNQLENIGEYFIKKEIRSYKEQNDFLSMQFFDMISKIKHEINKNNYEFSKKIENQKRNYPEVIKNINQNYENLLEKQKKEIAKMKNENKNLKEKWENLKNLTQGKKF